MNFIDRLLRKRPDPTAAWGVFRPPIPDFDLTEMRFGPLRFGDPFDAAALLGRPDSFEHHHDDDDYCELLYASGGFQIDYNKGRFAYLAFFIGSDVFLPKHPAFKFSQPRLRGCTPDGIRLTCETDRAMLDQVFGTADSTDADAEETILYCIRQNVTMEFEMDGKTERLKRWNLYPK